MIPLRASYRLQLRGGLTLARVRPLLAYLARLGVSHLYLSPIQQARPASPHGYDGVDPTRVDPVLGGLPALVRLAAAARRLHLGLLLDVVPNHLAADPANPAFDDVLAHGPASRWARWFDVDWGPPGARRHRPLLLPVLERPLAEALARDEFTLVCVDGVLRLRRHASSWPLDPATWPQAFAARTVGRRRQTGAALEALLAPLRQLPPRTRTDGAALRARAEASARARRRLRALVGRSPRALQAAARQLRGDAAARRRLAALLARQAWRPAPWKSARHRLNYRRFFDVNELIGIRVEDARVFAASHVLWLDLAARDLVDGLRIDHVDGLLDPADYLRRLRRALGHRLGAERGRRFVLLVEKILAADERLPRSWPVQGTTGYEFLNQLEDALLDPHGARALERSGARATGTRHSFAAAGRAGKRLVLRELLRADVRRLAADLAPHAPGVTPAELRTAIAETIVHLPVYRTYADRRGRLSRTDRARLARALADARRSGRAAPRALARVRQGLLGASLPGAPSRSVRVAFLRRFQQTSGPAAAKGIEDTAHYAHAPLLSRNEVGGEPGHGLEGAVAELHARNRERARHWPGTLLAASTHDTKRSADVRARLDVLTELPTDWARAVARWRRTNRVLRPRVGRRRLPDANTERFLYQTLVGVWPLGPRAPGPPARARLAARAEAYLVKAAREAKRETSWIDPDPAFEAALRSFVRALLAAAPRGAAAAFQRDLAAFVAEVARPGLWNALSRTLVQLSAPGVPDLYQGDELWTFSLVDPDNRGPVDFAHRARLLARAEHAFRAAGRRRSAFLRGLLARAEDGRLKLHAIHAALAARQRHPRLFAEGDYRPLRARGEHARHVIAFVRRSGRRAALSVVPRLPRTLTGDATRAPVGPAVWGATRIRLPSDLAGRTLRDALTGRRRRVPRAPARPELALAELLEELPVALLLG